MLIRAVDTDDRLHYLSFPDGISKYNTVSLVARYKLNKFTFEDFKSYGIPHSTFRKITSRMMQQGILEGSNTKPKIYRINNPDNFGCYSTDLEDKIAFLIIEDQVTNSTTDIYYERSADSLISSMDYDDNE